LSHTSSPFCCGYFGILEMESGELFLTNLSSLISASKVAGITGVWHQHPADHEFLKENVKSHVVRRDHTGGPCITEGPESPS
jgi:hypothetical protein